MPVWRPHRPWLEAAVGSALAQVGCDIELVVVDDGNDVPVAEVLAHVHDPRLRIVRIEHGGTSAARNAGTAAVRTPYLRYVDADDVLTSDGTARLLARATPGRLVHGATALCDEKLAVTKTVGSELEGDVARECLLGRFEMRHVSMLLPTEIARAAGGWDPEIRVCQDWDFVLRCLELAPVVAIPDVVTYYRRHPASATRHPDSRPAAWYGQRRVIEKYFERHPAERPGRLHREAWAIFHESWARRSLRERGLRRSAAEMAALLRLDPVRAAGVAGVGLRRLSRRVRRRVGARRR